MFKLMSAIAHPQKAAMYLLDLIFDLALQLGRETVDNVLAEIKELPREIRDWATTLDCGVSFPDRSNLAVAIANSAPGGADRRYPAMDQADPAELFTGLLHVSRGLTKAAVKGTASAGGEALSKIAAPTVLLDWLADDPDDAAIGVAAADFAKVPEVA